jgi:succinate-acetate transporter protein
LALTVPLQLLAAVMGFLARDPVAATAMGILAGTWAATSLSVLTMPPGSTSEGLGVILLCSALCLLSPATGARTKVIPCLVILTSAARFASTGIAESTGRSEWLHIAGYLGIALAIVSFYAALALELEGSESRTVLPLGRRGVSQEVMHETLADQQEKVAREPGVRRML